jgi:hypothetical protein
MKQVVRNPLHVELEAEIYGKLKGLLPDVLVTVGYKHIDRFDQGNGPEIAIELRLHRNNRILIVNQHIHTEFMPRDILARETAVHALRHFHGALME